MSIARVRPATWGSGAKLSSAEANALDENTTHALDKRAGQTDTLASDITLTGSINVEGLAFISAGGALEVNDATAKIDANISGAKIIASINGAKIAATAPGAKIRTETGGRLELADNDYPQLASGHTGRTVVRRISPGECMAQTTAAVSALQADTPLEGTTASVISRMPWAVTFQSVDTGASNQARALVYALGASLIDGATLTQVR
jgi:hypothetical protein